MDWNEFFEERRPYFWVITLGDEKAIEYLKEIYESEGSDTVLSALEVFDAAGFDGELICSLYEVCGKNSFVFKKVIANAKAGNIKLDVLKIHAKSMLPFGSLASVQDLPEDVLKPKLMK